MRMTLGTTCLFAGLAMAGCQPDTTAEAGDAAGRIDSTTIEDAAVRADKGAGGATTQDAEPAGDAVSADAGPEVDPDANGEALAEPDPAIPVDPGLDGLRALREVSTRPLEVFGRDGRIRLVLTAVLVP